MVVPLRLRRSIVMAKKKKSKLKRKSRDAGDLPLDGKVMDLDRAKAHRNAAEGAVGAAGSSGARVFSGVAPQEGPAGASIGKAVWRPGVDAMQDGEELTHDPSAYTTLHSVNVEWPCLSFDVLRDPYGMHRTKFPHKMYLACGSQAARAQDNRLYIVKASDVQRTYAGKAPGARDENAMDDSDDEEDYDDPTIEFKAIRHPGGVNRLRAMPQAPNVIATLSENKMAYIWDARQELSALDRPSDSAGPGAASAVVDAKPLASFSGHASEGYALDWSPTVAGRLLTGDCTKFIYLWERKQGAGWSVDKTPFVGHSNSVEDLQWSPIEKTVFASCSVDKTVRIWDSRTRGKSMLFVAAHHNDVNVISWNRKKRHLLLSGSDDTTFKVWDLRKFKSSQPVGHFCYHSAPITSIEWHPEEDAMLGVASADDQLTIWDLALEADVEGAPQGADVNVDDIPPQLLFVHQGQKNIKELHFHPQIPGLVVSTAESGLNIFKPSNLA